MKSITFFLAVLLALFLSENTMANQADSSKVVKKIIKTIEIDENGKTIVDSTIVYEGENMEDFMENFPGKEKYHKIIRKRMHSPHDNSMDWSDDDEMEFDIRIESDGDSSKVILLKSAKGIGKKFKFDDGAMKKHKIMMLHDDDDFHLAGPKKIREHRKNLIDLNDPEIISFEKETLKNGNEKITIIRKAEK